MRAREIRTVFDAAAWRLCSGCGACAALAPAEIAMVDVLDEGRRPMPHPDADAATVEAAGREALEVCPGRSLDARFADRVEGADAESRANWGPVLEVWEGHATDPRLRFEGSSGGAASALALHAIEDGGAHGVLHTGPRSGAPWLTEPVMSRSFEEILERSGSRYAPASPCEALGLIAAAPAPCVFVGKPCDVAAARRLAAKRGFARKLSFTVSVFCAGTPSHRGTLEFLGGLGVPGPRELRSLRYRGRGWPGEARAVYEGPDGALVERGLSYEESWGGILEKRREWRCYICPDHTGEFADLAVADAWHRAPRRGTDPKGATSSQDPGRSIIVVRTERGREVLREARSAGRLTLERVGLRELRASQPHFEASRGALWGRLLFLRLLRVPTPVYRGFPGFRSWLALPVGEKLRSTLGTVRRVTRKGLRRRAAIERWDPASVVFSGSSTSASSPSSPSSRSSATTGTAAISATAASSDSSSSARPEARLLEGSAPWTCP